MPNFAHFAIHEFQGGQSKQPIPNSAMLNPSFSSCTTDHRPPMAPSGMLEESSVQTEVPLPARQADLGRSVGSGGQTDAFAV